LLNTTVTTGNLFGAGTAVAIGASSGATLTLNPGTIVGANTTQNLFNTVATTLNIGGAATTVSIGAATGTTTVNNALTASPANLNVTFSPTGTGVVTINPATAGSIDRMNIGATTPGTGRFTSLRLGYTAVTGASYTIIATDSIVGVNYGGACALTLPAQAAGRYLVIKDESGAALTNNITITPASGTIDGASNIVLNISYGAYTLYSNGTNWFVI
jgi:hypothetical protein